MKTQQHIIDPIFEMHQPQISLQTLSATQNEGWSGSGDSIRGQSQQSFLWWTFFMPQPRMEKIKWERSTPFVCRLCISDLRESCLMCYMLHLVFTLCFSVCFGILVPSLRSWVVQEFVPVCGVYLYYPFLIKFIRTIKQTS